MFAFIYMRSDCLTIYNRGVYLYYFFLTNIIETKYILIKYMTNIIIIIPITLYDNDLFLSHVKSTILLVIINMLIQPITFWCVLLEWLSKKNYRFSCHCIKND